MRIVRENPLGKDTVLVVDEAGMIGTRQMAELVKQCDAAGSKLVLVGDGKQLQAVELGGAFQAIAGKTGEVRLSEIIRQKNEGDRRAVKDMAEGRSREALRPLR